MTSLVHVGDNSFEARIDWYQTEETYYALFGENVTENLKNCIVYHSEIEAVYLAGRFGVYSPDGFEDHDVETVVAHRFFIGKAPERISEPVLEGLPFFRGELVLRQKIRLPSKDVLLKVMGHYLTAEVKINGKEAGELLFERQLDISPYANEGENDIEVTFCLGNRNLLGPFHYGEPEGMIVPGFFEANTLPDNAKGEPGYKFYLFYTKK